MPTKSQITEPVADVETDLTSECPTSDGPHWWQTAKAEHAALKQWKLAGENGDRPSTPTLDEMNDRYVAAGCAPGSASPTRRRSPSSTPRRTKSDGVFVIDGVSTADRPKFGLSYLAYFHTAKIAAADSKRLPTKELRTLLESLGVTDVGEVGWAVTLPNGKHVEFVARDDDRAAQTTKAPRATKSTAKKSLTPKVDATIRRKLEQRDEVLADLKQPHTAAELVAIAEREGVAGINAKKSKAEIIDRITAAVTARTKHLQKSA